MSTKSASHQRARWFSLALPKGLEIELTTVEHAPILRLQLTVDHARALASQLRAQLGDGATDPSDLPSHLERELFLGAEFMTARARAGIRFEEAVARTGLSRSLLRDLEAGRIRPRYGSEVYNEVRAAIESFAAIPALREIPR